jgi:hypothetical protein
MLGFYARVIKCILRASLADRPRGLLFPVPGSNPVRGLPGLYPSATLVYPRGPTCLMGWYASSAARAFLCSGMEPCASCPHFSPILDLFAPVG